MAGCRPGGHGPANRRRKTVGPRRGRLRPDQKTDRAG
jgi:hypothetical protein